MLTKLALVPEVDEYGFVRVFPFGARGSGLEKYASIPEGVQRYAESFKPQHGELGILVTAMGALEAWSANSNSDAWTERSLNHLPADWADDAEHDRAISGGWGWGLPTFYRAKVFAHHRNRDQAKAIGDIGYVTWDPHMKWVLIAVLIDPKRAGANGGQWVLDRVGQGRSIPWSMGCFTKGTPITLSDGRTKPIEQVRQGDFVLNASGEPVRVTELHTRPYTGQLISVTPHSLDPIRATEEHPFLVYKREAVKYTKRPHRELATFKAPGDIERARPTWVLAKDLKVGDMLVQPAPIGTATPDYVSVALARLLGYYLAEGHLLYNKRHEPFGIELTVGEGDAALEEIDDLCAAFGTKNAPHVAPRRNSDRAFAISIFDRRLALLCLAHAGCYAKEKALSESVMYWDTEMQLHLLGAYINGDGGQKPTRLCKGRRYVSGEIYISTSNVQLANQVSHMLARCGALAATDVLAHHPSASSVVDVDTTEYHIDINKGFSSIIASYARVDAVPVRVNNHRRFRLSNGFILTPIKSIQREPLHYVGSVYNFEVERGASYVVGHVAVHNCRVPFDMQSTSKDWEAYEKAWASYDPSKHKTPADAILDYHDHVKLIHGLSRTRREYTDEMLFHANEIRRDGRKIYVYNDFPTFFDLSAVGVPADQVAWSMFKLGSRCVLTGSRCAGACRQGACAQYTLPGVVLEERFDMLMDKAASVHQAAIGKGAVVRKDADIDKQVEPQTPGTAPLKSVAGEDEEPSLPRDLLNLMGERKGMGHALSTPTCLGMVLKPEEFRRLVLVRTGRRGLADKLDDSRAPLPASFDEESPGTMSPEAFDDDLARMLAPMVGKRSWLGPVAVKRIQVTIVRRVPGGDVEEPELQRKISALYNGYRKQASALLERAPTVLANRSHLRATIYGFGDLNKHGSTQVQGALTPLVTGRTREYFRDAYAV